MKDMISLSVHEANSNIRQILAINLIAERFGSKVKVVRMPDWRGGCYYVITPCSYEKGDFEYTEEIGSVSQLWDANPTFMVEEQDHEGYLRNYSITFRELCYTTLNWRVV